MRKFGKYLLGLALAAGLAANVSAGQDKVDQKAFQLMDKALGNALESGNAALYFEGIAYGLKDPLSIFSLPVYQVVRGGYLFIHGKKHEMHLGSIKSLSDGKLVVVVDEISKTMFIDSVRNASQRYFEEKPDLSGLFSQLGDADLVYRGTQKVNGRDCHRITSTFDKVQAEVTYYIDQNTGQLYLMAEKQEGSYNVYWFNRISKVSPGHVFSVNLPKGTGELDKLYGYEVIDHRFISEQLKSDKK
jgi:hypothetical protein